MAQMRAVDNSEYDEFMVHYQHGPPVKYISRRVPPSREWHPWVCVGQSAILTRLGREGNGLFAARSFKAGDIVGRYEGSLVGHFATRKAALAAPQTRRLLMRGHDKMVTLRPGRGAGFQLIDGSTAGPPYISLCNDPRNTRLHPNCELTDAGYLRVTAAHVPAFNLNKTDNAPSELRFEYGQAFWDLHDALGTGSSSQHAIEVD